MTVSNDVRAHKTEHSPVTNKVPTTFVAADLEVKKAKKKQSSNEASSSKSSARMAKKQRLSTVQNDIRVPSQNRLNSSDSDDSANSSPFGSNNRHWEPDPLTLFMFENAPEIIKLCQRAQDAMVKAEVSQTKLQGQNALQSAKETADKGRNQAKQQKLRAASEFAQAGVAAMQGCLQFKDQAIGDDTHARNAEAHEQVMKGLTSAKSENITEAGGEVGASANASENNPGAGALSTEDQNAIIEKAKEFKEVQQQRYEEIYAERQNHAATKVKKSIFGLNRTEEWVDGENDILAHRQASKEAFEQVLGSESQAPQAYSATELSEPEQANRLSKLLNGDGATHHQARKLFMSHLFEEAPSGLNADGSANNKTPPMNLETRMTLVGEWGEGTALRHKMLKSYGATEQGAKMREDFSQHVRVANDKAGLENSHNQKTMSTRMNLLQNLTGKSFDSLFNALQKAYIVNASKNESSASLSGSIAQMLGQAKGAEESFIANSIKDMTGIFEWYQGMLGQLISAQSSAAGA